MSDDPLGLGIEVPPAAEDGLKVYADTRLPRCPVCAVFLTGPGFSRGTCSQECARTAYIAAILEDIATQLRAGGLG